jgi:hypothetical protein
MPLNVVFHNLRTAITVYIAFTAIAVATTALITALVVTLVLHRQRQRSATLSFPLETLEEVLAVRPTRS